MFAWCFELYMKVHEFGFDFVKSLFKNWQSSAGFMISFIYLHLFKEKQT